MNWKPYKGPPQEAIYRGWAIQLPYEYYALAGVLFWGETPEHIRTVRTAVFRTRKEAREAKKVIYCGGKVVRVEVRIKEFAPGEEE